jgi:type VI secretion system Hcp family effector
MADDLDAYLTFSDGTAGKSSFPAIAGETHDVTEKDFSSMQIRSYRFGFELEDTETEETVSKDGKSNPHAPSLRAVQITKSLDMSSPQLFKALTAAARFDYAWLWQKKAGGQKGASGDYYWMIEMRQVTVTSVEWSAQAGDAPEETVMLKFQEISAEYLPQKRTGELDKSKRQSVDYTPDTAWVPDKGNKGKDGKSNGSTDLNDFDPVRMKPFVDKLVHELKRRGDIK